MKTNHIGCGMVYMLSLTAVDRGFDIGQTKDYKVGICCFSARHTVFRSKSKDWLTWNQDNEWNDMSARELIFQ